MKKELTSKEKLFCAYYCAGRNGREAAAKSGYRFAERSAEKLLRRKDILSYIAKNDKTEKAGSADITAGYYRLAFGCVADAVSLLFTDEFSESNIEGLDLFNVSEIKRQKGGAIEIKFFDRLKALEKLSEINGKTVRSSQNSLYSAIEKSASALKEWENNE
ncbi:MAG: terminase small subunit [Clostridia bacterium]|nr:terminase small subunit [Clostridia bacterium]